MSEVEVRLRRLEQTKKHQTVASRQQPSIGEMSDGDERIVLAGGKTLRLYRKEFGKLWYMDFTGT